MANGENGMPNRGFELSLVNIKGAAKTVEKLVDVVSRAIGRLYTPLDKIVNAHADAQVVMINARAQQKKEDETERRAMARLAHTESRRQQNIDSIILGTVAALPANADQELGVNVEVDEDWVAAFFEHCKDVGNAEMRQIWARMLAGEIVTPGTFSRRTLSIVQSMDKDDADAFTRLCSISFEFSPGEYAFFIPSWNTFEYLRERLLSTDEEIHLKNIGLLSSNNIYLQLDDPHEIDYFGKKFLLSSSRDETVDPEDADCTAELYPFTKAGNELRAIAGAQPDKRFLSLWQEDSKIDGNTYLKGVAKSKKTRR